MAEIHFTSAMQRHVECQTLGTAGATVREALQAVFDRNASLESYFLDDQGALRKHIVIFVDGQQVRDRTKLAHPIGENSRIDVMQALSGG